MQTGDKYIQTFTLTSAVYNGFIEVFNDRNPLHTDNDFAIGKGFKGRVMHGNILNGFISFFIGECLPMKNVMIYSQNINFTLPVYENEEMEFNAEIAGFYDSVNTYEFKFFFKNTDGRKVAKGNIQIGLLR